MVKLKFLTYKVYIHVWNLYVKSPISEIGLGLTQPYKTGL
jgi:hypothetical protein